MLRGFSFQDTQRLSSSLVICGVCVMGKAVGQAAGNRAGTEVIRLSVEGVLGCEGLPGVIEPFCANSAVTEVSLQAWMETGGFVAWKAGLVLGPCTCVSTG